MQYICKYVKRKCVHVKSSVYYRCPGTRYAFVLRFQDPSQTTGNEANISAGDCAAGWPKH